MWNLLKLNKAIIIIILVFINFNCLKNIELNKDQLKLFQFLLLTYPDIIIQQESKIIYEGQLTKFNIKLKNEPNNNVIIPVNTNSDLIQLSTSQLIFNSSNWDNFQEITIFAPEDDYFNESHQIPIQFGPSLSGDILYNGKGFVIDLEYLNNDYKGIYFYHSHPTEGGPNGSLTLSLQSKPKGDVTIYIDNPSPADLSFSSNSITFTPTNWNIPQTITITAIDDIFAEYTESFNIVLSTSSSDPDYNNLVLYIFLNIYDDDIPGFKLNVSSFYIVEGNTFSVNIQLDTAPTSNVNVSITATPLALCTISSGSSLTFTPANYNINQSFTIQAKPSDNIDDIPSLPYHNCQIQIVGTSSDPLYNGLSETLIGHIEDFNNAGIIVSSIIPTIKESGTSGSFNIVLLSEPTQPVTVCFKSTNYCESYVENTGINAPDGTCTSITGANTPYWVFNNTNWNMPKTIFVKGRHDWEYRSGALTIPETGGHCNPPYPDRNKYYQIHIHTYCPTCNNQEKNYYHTNNTAFNHKPYGQVQDDLDLWTFITSYHNGDFNNDLSLSRANAIQKADDYCNQQNPFLPGTYKAFLVDGANRSACGNGLDFPTCSGKIDWVLKPNKYYFRNHDDKLLFKTDINGFFIFGDPDAFGIPSESWTGIGPSNWADSFLNCSAWSDLIFVGDIGDANVNTYSAINATPSACISFYKILCIQQ